MGKVRDWFEGKGLEAEAADPEPPQAEGSPYTGERDLPARPAAEEKPPPPGWYQVEGTLRYYDGESWTGHVAPPYPPSLSTPRIASAVFLGVFGALFIVWFGAQIDPDHVYFPVKFVVEELPEALK